MSLAAIKPDSAGATAGPSVGQPDKHPHIEGGVQEPIEARKLFIRGIPFDATTATLKSTFAALGALEDCEVCMDRATGRSKYVLPVCVGICCSVYLARVLCIVFVCGVW